MCVCDVVIQLLDLRIFLRTFCIDDAIYGRNFFSIHSICPHWMRCHFVTFFYFVCFDIRKKIVWIRNTNVIETRMSSTHDQVTSTSVFRPTKSAKWTMWRQFSNLKFKIYYMRLWLHDTKYERSDVATLSLWDITELDEIRWRPRSCPCRESSSFPPSRFFHRAGDWRPAFDGRLGRDGSVAAETETVVTATGMTGTAHIPCLVL